MFASSGHLCEIPIDDGWPFIFYTNGANRLFIFFLFQCKMTRLMKSEQLYSIFHIIHHYEFLFTLTIIGGVTLVWLVMWLVFMTDSPVSHRWISIQESNYIRGDDIDNLRKKVLVTRQSHR